MVLGPPPSGAPLPLLASQQGFTARVSVSSTGQQAQGTSLDPALTPDGRFVAFDSDAPDLVPGDANLTGDVFVHDRLDRTTSLVSVDSFGAQGNGFSFGPSLSADGRLVAFESFASNLVPGDANGLSDVFLRDRGTGLTLLVSATAAGTAGNSRSDNPSLSADGRFVAFYSFASDLVAGDANASSDVFVFEAATGALSLVSVDSAGIQANRNSSTPSISADGRYVAFVSGAPNLDPGDANDYDDVFRHDRATGLTNLVSVASSGASGNGDCSSPSISADGRFVVFYSVANNLVPGDSNGVGDAFLRDLRTGLTTRVSVSSSGAQGNGISGNPALSPDGRYVAFQSDATNLVTPDANGSADVFVHERETGRTVLVSTDSAGAQGNSYSILPVVATHRRLVAYASLASNLVTGDTNAKHDIFVFKDKTKIAAVAGPPLRGP